MLAKNPRKPIVILDMDGVILDEVAFKLFLASNFLKFGVNFWKTYPECKDEKGIYQFEKQVCLINSLIKQKEMRARATLGMSDFLFPDAITFIKENKDKLLFIITFGEESFQNRKLSGLLESGNIIGCFSKIIVTEEPKVKHLRRICDSNQDVSIFFIDDTPKELARVRKTLSHRVHCIRMNRYGASPDFSFFEVKNLEQAHEAIERFLDQV